MAQVGKVLGFRAQFGSGIAEFFLEVDGEQVMVPCEAGPTIRSLNAAFPDGVINGQEIEYEVDDLGVMRAFAPVGMDGA